jgi:anti-sigma-K factor RskA
MTVSPDDDFAAAEYVLGTLDPGERAVVAARRLREPDLDEAIRAWEARLAPLAEAAGPIEPPRGLLPAIEARIRGATPEAAGNPGVDALRRSLIRWRAAAIAASIVAGVLAVGFAARETTREALPHQYVAILQKDAASPAFAITVNLDSREFTVRPIAATAPPGKAYELWLIDPKIGAPRSLGVIAANSATRSANLAQYDRAVVADATYAVTIEPPGGSPTGQPSGPPVFVGKLIPVGP